MPLTADRAFFDALVAGDTGSLNRLLADDFLLIDVLRGMEIPKDALVSAIASNQVRFDSIEASETHVRLYGDTAVINGRTRMSLRAGEDAMTVHSRYTHVYVRRDEGWHLVNAQGTPIA